MRSISRMRDGELHHPWHGHGLSADTIGHTTRLWRATNGHSCFVMLRECHCQSPSACLRARLTHRLELYFSDKRNFLIVFRDQRQRQAVVQKLASKDEQKDAISRSVIGNFVLDQVARATDRSEQQLLAMTRKWQSREISNVSGGALSISTLLCGLDEE